MPKGIGYGKTVPSKGKTASYGKKKGGGFGAMIAKRANKKAAGKGY